MLRARTLTASLARALALTLVAGLPVLPAAAAGQNAPELADHPPSPPSGERGKQREVLLTGLGADADLLRLAGLAGAAPVGSEFLRRAGARTVWLPEGEALGWTARLPSAPGKTGLALLPARLDTVYSTRYPEAANDGLLWQGRGFGTRASAGVFARAGAFSAALQPELAWQQNAWFETIPTGRPDAPFANPWYGTNAWDGPQRFGPGPFWSASPGQSYVRADAYGVGLGVSTENRWLGPGSRTAILLTDAGPGFPHAFLGTSKPVDFGVGGVEALALWGRLDRSRHGGDGGHPWFTALALGWEPRWTPGFHVGLARAVVERWASLRDDHLLSIVVPPSNSRDSTVDPTDNEVVTAWFRWVLPESALELYGEWGKDDLPASAGALLRETERTQAWLLGAQKLGRVGGRRVRVQVELAKFAGGGWPFYQHGSGVGWTNAGQPLGSYAGPGGILSFAAVDVLAPWGRLGGFVERLERNTTVFDERFAPLPERRTDRDTELTAGVRGVTLAGPLELTWEAAGGYRWNRDFARNEPNARVSLSFAAPAGR